MVKAIAVLRGDKNTTGTVLFEQTSENEPTKVTYNITGNDASAKRGFHIHKFGDTSNGCTSAGPHFNPHGVDHGHPDGSKEERHIGDMGNLYTDANGVAKGQFTDKLLSLFGTNTIVGRSVVIHEGEDDYGKGGFDDSKATGHALGRAACGVVGMTTDDASV